MQCFYYFFSKKSKKPLRPCISSSIRSVSSSCEIKREAPSSFAESCKEKIKGLRAFSYSELHAATNGFSTLERIGIGGFGSVYKGFIKSSDPRQRAPIQVAVKKLDRGSVQVPFFRCILFFLFCIIFLVRGSSGFLNFL